jgi:hypothetical protein
MSQLNFFLTQDEILFKLNTIIKSGEYVVFNGKAFNTRSPEPVADVSQIVGFQELVLWVKDGDSTPVASVVGSDAMAGKFLFDHLKDPVIEVENCSYSDHLISPGRIYFKAGWIEEEGLRKMHQKAANKVLRLFDKDMLRVQQQWRVSPEVKHWVLQGGELELGVNGMRINKEHINAA